MQGGAHSIPCHQVAVRMAGKTSSNSDIISKFANNNLCGVHVDSGDGRRKNGAPLLYALDVPSFLEGKICKRPMPESDLVIFEGVDGGRAVRIQTACPHHICIVIFNACDHAHSNVYPSSRSLNLTPDLLLLRVVPYSLRRIDDYIGHILSAPHLWEEEKEEVFRVRGTFGINKRKRQRIIIE